MHKKSVQPECLDRKATNSDFLDRYKYHVAVTVEKRSELIWQPNTFMYTCMSAVIFETLLYPNFSAIITMPF